MIERVRGRVAFELEVIDIDDPAQERWLDLYDAILAHVTRRG